MRSPPWFGLFSIYSPRPATKRSLETHRVVHVQSGGHWGPGTRLMEMQNAAYNNSVQLNLCRLQEAGDRVRGGPQPPPGARYQPLVHARAHSQSTLRSCGNKSHLLHRRENQQNTISKKIFPWMKESRPSAQNLNKINPGIWTFGQMMLSNYYKTIIRVLFVINNI